MYAQLSNLLSDQKGDIIFTCFGTWHICYLAELAVVVTAILLSLKNKNRSTILKTTEFFINCAFGLYIADFFLMPFAYGGIDVEKLPFHACTAMCVMCFLSCHTTFFSKYKASFAMLGFLSNLVYCIYPAGLMWYQVHPLSYRVIQTLMFHAIMAIYGLLVLIFEKITFDKYTCRRDFTVIAGMTLWALLGNALYTGQAWGHTYFFNWFFVVEDPFGIFAPEISRYIMPVLNTAVFFSVSMLVHLIRNLFLRKANAKTAL